MKWKVQYFLRRCIRVTGESGTVCNGKTEAKYKNLRLTWVNVLSYVPPTLKVSEWFCSGHTVLLYTYICWNQNSSSVGWKTKCTFSVTRTCSHGRSHQDETCCNVFVFVSLCLSCRMAPAPRLSPTGSVSPPSSALIRLPRCTTPLECSSSRSGNGPRLQPFSKQQRFSHQ